MERSGAADLPLHGGRVPPWLAGRMTELGTAISVHILLEYSAPESLTRMVRNSGARGSVTNNLEVEASTELK
ncbi:MAG: DUF763 domain-containing protein [Terracidiphilus sp.]